MADVIQQLVNGLSIGSLYALVAIGLTLIFGIMHIINFAHGEFYMLGAYVSYYLFAAYGMDFFLSLLLAMAAVMIIGFLFERYILKAMRDLPLTIPMLATIGLWILSQNVALLIWGPVAKATPSPFSVQTLQIGPAVLTVTRIFAGAVATCIIILAHLFIQKTRLGKALRATFQDRETAALLGVRVDQVHSLTFVMGAGLAAAAGALLGPVFIVYPSMGNSIAIKAFAVVVMGGMGSFIGSILGGLILGVTESFGSGYISAAYQDAIAFIIIIIVLVFRPSGLFAGRFGKREYVG